MNYFRVIISNPRLSGTEEQHEVYYLYRLLYHEFNPEWQLSFFALFRDGQCTSQEMNEFLCYMKTVSEL